ncbi:MAG TPA: M20/M25/M40 family metallo-hydrolase [Candidatus Solibacter sp.]|jgi:acetylornithine deacetylase/succinyl-diaminopimelate desuccinylase-like protein|nr:M20/M25/M40 family metallo-hydrolase [Candidatus Solibacter sp.]
MQDVFDEIDRNRAEYIDRLRRLVQQPSVAAQNRGVAEARAVVTDLANAAGATVEEVATSGQSVLWIDFGGAGQHTVNLYNHYDVQPEDPIELWEVPPFDLTERDGKLYGRGVADDKGVLVARICAIEAYSKVRGQLPLKVRMAAEGEEEIGSPHVNEFVDKFEMRLREADAVIWEGTERNLAGQVEADLGGKGLMYIELTAHGSSRDEHSMYGGILPNPAWRLVRLLGEMVSPDGTVQIPGFYDDIRDVDDATMKLLDSFPFDAVTEREERGLSAWSRGIPDSDVARELRLGTTSNIAGFVSGYGGQGPKTVTPASALVKMDFRLVPDQDPDKIGESLRQWMKDRGYGDVQLELVANQRASRGRADHPIVTSLVRAGEMVGLDCRVAPNSPGTGPIYPMCDRLGLTMVGGEAVARSTSLFHSPNEHIHADEYIQAMKHFIATLDIYASA